MRAVDIIEAARQIDEKYEVFAERLEDPLANEGEYKFHFSAKDCLCSIDFQTRAGSQILDGYQPPFDATAIHRLREAG